MTLCPHCRIQYDKKEDGCCPICGHPYDCECHKSKNEEEGYDDENREEFEDEMENDS